MNETSAKLTRNPWLTMWLEPRVTIREVVAWDPVRMTHLLAALSGVGVVLDRAVARSAGDYLPLTGVFLLALGLGPFVGLIKLYIGTAILGMSCHWLGGRATSVELRCAIAWSNVIPVWALALWVPQVVLFGHELFTTETPGLDANPLLGVPLVGFGLLDIGLAVWAVVVALHAIAEVQGFSAWKALLAVILAVVIVLLPIVAVFLIAG